MLASCDDAGRLFARLFPRFDRRPIDDPFGYIVLSLVAVCIAVFFGLMSSFTVALSYMAGDATLADRDNTPLLNLGGSLQLAVARVFGVIGGLLMPRWGTQPLLVVASVALVFAFFFSSFVPSVGAFVAVYTTFMAVAFGFLISPGLVAAGSYFDSKRSRAFGALSAFCGLVQGALPLAFDALCRYFAKSGSWRPAFRVFSAVALVNCVAAVFCPTRVDEVAMTPTWAPQSYSHKRLFSCPQFVILAASFVCVGFTLYGQTFVIVPLALAQGHGAYADSDEVPSYLAALLLLFRGVGTVLGNIVWGAAGDTRLGPRFVHGLVYLVNSAVLVAWVVIPRQPYVARALLVAASGFFSSPLEMPVMESWFGGHHLGEIVALLYCFLGAGGAASPPLIAWMTQSYGGSFLPGVVMIASLGALIPALLFACPTGKPNLYEPHDPFEEFGPVVAASPASIGDGNSPYGSPALEPEVGALPTATAAQDDGGTMAGGRSGSTAAVGMAASRAPSSSRPPPLRAVGVDSGAIDANTSPPEDAEGRAAVVVVPSEAGYHAFRLNYSFRMFSH